jgi:WD40 repeat protein
VARLYPYAALSRDGRFAAAVGYDHASRSDALEVWEVAGRHRLWRALVPTRTYCRGVALAPDGRAVVALTAPAAPLADGRTGQVVARLEHPQPPHLAAFSPDGRLLATATGASRRVWLWHVANRRCVTKLRAFRQAPEALAFHPDGRLLAAGATDGLIRLWDTTTFREVAALNWKIGPIRALAFAPDGMTAAAAGVGSTVVVWDVDEA